jgi:hypothetical protein
MPDSLRLAAWPSTGPAWFVFEPDAAARKKRRRRGLRGHCRRRRGWQQGRLTRRQFRITADFDFEADGQSKEQSDQGRKEVSLNSWADLSY